MESQYSIIQHRLYGLTLMCVHNDILKNQKFMVIKKIIKLFCIGSKRVQFLFND